MTNKHPLFWVFFFEGCLFFLFAYYQFHQILVELKGAIELFYPQRNDRISRIFTRNSSIARLIRERPRCRKSKREHHRLDPISILLFYRIKSKLPEMPVWLYAMQELPQAAFVVSDYAI